MRFRLLSLGILLPLALLSCRGSSKPPDSPAERIALKRQHMAEVRRWIDSPASQAEQLISSNALARLTQDLEVELGATNLPPELGELPPAVGGDLATFVPKAVAYDFTMLRGFENFWLAGPPADGLRDASMAVDDLRQGHLLWLETYRRESGKPYAYTDDQRAFLRATSGERQKQLEAEKDPARRAFLQASLDWWKGRAEAK